MKGALTASPWQGTGRGIRVAILDSGINPQHSHVQRVEGGIHFFLNEGRLDSDCNWRDGLGHGTAIAGVVRAKAPDALLYGVKIFNRELRTHAEVVAAALAWCADQEIQVANCSFSTGNAEHTELLEQACDLAETRGMIVVASANEEVPALLPASLRNVFAVSGDAACGWDEYWYQESDNMFRAHPHPRPLPHLPQERNLRGPSFAAAHITACVARLLEQWPTARQADIFQLLRDHAIPVGKPLPAAVRG